jgi:hypothetical protein
VDSNELIYARGVLIRLANAARSEPQLAPQIRELVVQTGILEVFGEGEQLNVLDLLQAGGEPLLRARLGELTLAQLKQMVAANQYDPDKTASRWRSTAKVIDLIVTRAHEDKEREALAQLAVDQPTVVLSPQPTTPQQPAIPAAPKGASWML